MRTLRAASLLLVTVSLTAAVLWASGSPLGPPPAQAQAPASCDARGAIYRQGKIVVHMRGQTVRKYFLCSERIRQPRKYHVRRIDSAEDDPFAFGLRGRRLLHTDFHVTTQTELLAWVDLVTAQYREVKIPKDLEYDEIRALGADGGIAFVTTDADEGQRIWYAAPGRRALATPRVVVRIPDGDIAPASLSIRRGMVRWKTGHGPPRSAPLTGTARTVPGAPLVCDSQERIYRDGPVRIFMRTVGKRRALLPV